MLNRFRNDSPPTSEVAGAAGRPSLICRGFKSHGWLAAAAVLIAVERASAATAFSARVAGDTDALFQRESGWIGGDGVGSTALSENSTLWLFTDTYVGENKDGRRVNARLVSNSIALQRRGDRPEFFYGLKPDQTPDAFFKPKDDRGYLWPTAAIRTKQGLWIFLQQAETLNEKSPFSVRLIGTWLAQVSNPDDAPAKWQITQQRIPFSRFPSAGQAIFGSAVLRDGRYLYIYGNEARTTKSKRGMNVARVPEEEFSQFDRWSFFNGRRWRQDSDEAAVISSGVPIQFSVTYLPGANRYAAIHTERGLLGKIVLRLAPSPEGPWENPRTVFQCPEATEAKQIVCYAARAHPQLAATPDELMVSYTAGAASRERVLNDTSLYWPRFVRVKIQPGKK